MRKNLRVFIALCLLLATWRCSLLSAQGEVMKVYVVSDGYKIDERNDRVFTQDPNISLDKLKTENHIWSARSATVSIAGARGEVVAFQLMIEGGAKGLKEVDVEVEEFHGPGRIDKEAIQLFKEFYHYLGDAGSGSTPDGRITADGTDRPSMGKGWYPDALVPWAVDDCADYTGYDGPPFDIAPNEVQGVWVDLYIPRSARAGKYTCDITVKSSAGTKRVNLDLQVRDFTIPRTVHSLWYINMWEGTWLNNGAQDRWLKGKDLVRHREEVHRVFRRHRIIPGNMYYSADSPEFRFSADGKLKKVDWSNYDAHYEKVLNREKNILGRGEPPVELWRVPLPPSTIGCFSDEDWGQMVEEVVRHWDEKGWDISRAYVYLADEPSWTLADLLRRRAKIVKERSGGRLHRQIAVYRILGRGSWDQQQRVFDKWKDVLDWWLIAGDFYHPPATAQLPQDAWRGIYQGGEPYQGNEALDADGIALRTWPWIAWRYKLDYMCYYSSEEGGRAADCGVWQEVLRIPRRSWAISQGVFMYPGKRVNCKQPIVNIRFKQCRRGQMDFEYFWLLRKAGKEELADRLVKKVINVALSEAAPRPELYGAGKWSHDPAVWDSAIAEAAGELARLKDILPREK